MKAEVIDMFGKIKKMIFSKDVRIEDVPVDEQQLLKYLDPKQGYWIKYNGREALLYYSPTRKRWVIAFK